MAAAQQPLLTEARHRRGAVGQAATRVVADAYFDFEHMKNPVAKDGGGTTAQTPDTIAVHELNGHVVHGCVGNHAETCARAVESRCRVVEKNMDKRDLHKD